MTAEDELTGVTRISEEISEFEWPETYVDWGVGFWILTALLALVVR